MATEIKEKDTVQKIETKGADESKLFVEREKFVGNDGKDYWSYILKGKIRNRDIKVDFAPKDKGGYEPLDILFDVQEKAELVIAEEEMTDSVSGKKTKYSTYTLQTTDEDGVVYQCGVKPSRDSDKALLLMLLNIKKAKSKA